MKLKLVILSMMALTLVLMSNSGCEETQTSDVKLNAKQERMMQEANAQVGMPAIKNFQERKFAKKILEMRDDPKLICYAYTVCEMTGKMTFIGKCIGYGLPYSTQYTNPEKLVWKDNHGYFQLPQADPNGLFSPASADATWLLMINPHDPSDIQPVYFEQQVNVSPFPLD